MSQNEINIAVPSVLQGAFGTGLRDIVKLVGFYLVGTSKLSEPAAQMYGGIVMIVVGLAWSQYVSWQKQKKLAVTTTAVHQMAPEAEISVTAALNRAQLTVNAK